MTIRILQAALFAGALFVGVLLCCRIGWLLGRRRLQIVGDRASAGLGTVEGAVFALMGLLVAFTFTSAAERFDHRRDLITEEVNAIGTAWLRLDLLEAQARADARNLFQQYVDARIALYVGARDPQTIAVGLEKSNAVQAAIWARLIDAVNRDPSPRLATLVLPPVNEMFDLAEARLLSTQQHPPPAIYLMLGLLVLASALLAGFGMAESAVPSPFHVIAFAFIVSLAVYLIVDLDYPRLGLIRVDAFDAALVSLRETMR